MKSKENVFVPPDGGWGYMIWISATINFVSICSLAPSFGLLFNDLIEKLDMSTTTIAFLNGLSCISFSSSGFLTGPLLKIISMRRLSLIAAVILNIGALVQVFANSTLMFFIAQAVFQAFGGGFLYNICFTSINSFFAEKRLLSISICQGITCTATIASPFIVKLSLEHYGYHGTMLFVLALTMHTFISTVLLQPVEWHQRKVTVNHESKEMNPLVHENQSVEDGKIDKNISGEVDKLQEDAIQAECTFDKYENVIQIILDEKEKDIDSLESIDKSQCLCDIIQIKIKEISNFFDLSLLKDFNYLNTCLGMSFAGVSIFIYELMFPLAMYNEGWNSEKVALGLSLTAFGDLATRIGLIFISKFFKIRNRSLYLVGLFIAFVSRLGVSLTSNTSAVLGFLVIMGTSRGILHLGMPLVMGDCVERDRFSSGMGLLMLMFGFISIAFGLIIGVIRDLSESYATAFHVLNSCFLIVMLFWSIEMCYSRRQIVDNVKTKRNIHKNRRIKKK